MGSSTSPMAIESNQVRQNTVLAMDSHPLPNIPHEIIFDILLRLPVKSLLRFRCVSKSWGSLISQPKFAKTHISLASTNTDNTHDRLLLRWNESNDLRCDLKSCSISAIMHELSDTAVSLDYPIDGSCNWEWIVGSCNGLVCGTVEKRTVFLWNPSTMKSRKLPDVGMLLDKYPAYMREIYPVYGFGYDESTDDYKVVLIFQARVDWGDENMVMVYSLRTDSWRIIGGYPRPLHVAGLGKFASGALHWIASSGSRRFIFSLDLARETYGEVSQPEYVGSRRYLTMDVLGGCLCMVCHYDGFGVDLWVMKEYGIRESWTKLAAILDKTHSLYGQLFTPICILKNGDILMAVRKRLVQYSPKDGVFYDPMIFRCFPPLSVYPYIGSLVSPDTDAGNGV
ncbi:hypothetical protein RHMOL_Rhmol02G0061700 [Rhododendron molle]|uniref:Uncharacterized protein n=1 Tax=Rhododendron molle TaxID=49168 RepID=A0ACC0PNJ1_RHOML|nr:hypothetical protein RHMOL_Rhmol02G0061700 [Rhododendron molle]